MRIGWKQAVAGLAAMAIGASAAVFAQSGIGGGETSDRAAIEAVVHDYILAHPEIIPQAMDKLQQRQTADLLDANRHSIETPYPGAIADNPRGDVTLVEYLDYACGFCKASVPDIDRLIAADPNVRIVFRELPILSDVSMVAARASLAAAAQGRFYAFHKALYAGGQLSVARIAAAAQQTGVAHAGDTPPDADAEIAANIAMARTLHLSGTPSFIVGDQVLSGAVGFDALQKAVEDARAAKRG